MNISWRTPPELFMDHIERDRVEKTMAILGLESGTAIDSYQMGPDGPRLSSIFIVSGEFLIETEMTTPDISFDVALANALVNYRVRLGVVTQAVPAPQVTEAAPALSDALAATDTLPPAADQAPPPRIVRTKFAGVNIRHTDRMESGLSYFGEDSEDWLAFVLRAYPKELLRKSGR